MTIFSTECYIMHPFLYSLLRISFPTLHPKVTEEYLTFPKKNFFVKEQLYKKTPLVKPSFYQVPPNPL
jgi:hypothetical protein